MKENISLDLVAVISLTRSWLSKFLANLRVETLVSQEDFQIFEVVIVLFQQISLIK